MSQIVEFESHRKSFFIETNEKDHIKLRELMRNSSADIFIAYRKLLGETTGYNVYNLYTDPLVLVTSKKRADEMEWHGKIDLVKASDERFCFTRSDSRFFSFCMNACKNAGFTPQLTLSEVTLATIRQYIRKGLRSTLQPMSFAREVFSDPECKIFFLEHGPKLTLSMFVNKQNRSPLVGEFVTYMTDAYKPKLL